jgi:lysine 6-dehydrogenase
MEERQLDKEASFRGVSPLPDCGLAPGLSNLLSAYAIEQLPQTTAVRVRCGGLPKMPKPPLHYKLVFSFDGFINEYSGHAVVLRNGKIAHVPALTELETVDILGLAPLEAVTTSGGTSTAPYTFLGRIQEFDYKTLRYPGHFSMFQSYVTEGWFHPSRRQAFCEMIRPMIDFPDDLDQVILLIETTNPSGQKYRALLIDDSHSDDSPFTAMEGTTAFPSAAIRARGIVRQEEIMT